MNGMDVSRICASELSFSIDDMEEAETEAHLNVLYERAKDQLDSLYHALKTKLGGL
jgi:hypothetical protein